MRAYSRDLRERIFRDSDGGMPSVAVAEKYDVSRAWVDRLKQRRRETGEVSPRAQRYGPHPKLGPHLHRLADLIHEQPDRTLAELQEALGLSASLATIWRAVKQLGFTVKKKRCARPNTAGPTSPLRGSSGRPRRRRGTRRTSSFSMKPASRRIFCAGMDAACAATGSAIMRRSRAGRRAPLSPAYE